MGKTHKDKKIVITTDEVGRPPVVSKEKTPKIIKNYELTEDDLLELELAEIRKNL